jgi:hypothetical protein
MFDGIRLQGAETAYNPVMAMIIGVATLLALLKTQSALMQMTYVSSGPKSLRKLSHEFMNGVNHMTPKRGASKPELRPSVVVSIPSKREISS